MAVRLLSLTNGRLLDTKNALTQLGVHQGVSNCPTYLSLAMRLIEERALTSQVYPSKTWPMRCFNAEMSRGTLTQSSLHEVPMQQSSHSLPIRAQMWLSDMAVRAFISDHCVKCRYYCEGLIGASKQGYPSATCLKTDPNCGKEGESWPA